MNPGREVVGEAVRITDSAALAALVRRCRGQDLLQSVLARHARMEALGHDAIAEFLFAGPGPAVAVLANPGVRRRPADLVAALVGLSWTTEKAKGLLPLVHAMHEEAYHILEGYTLDQVLKGGDDAHDLALMLLSAAPTLSAQTLDAIIDRFGSSAVLMRLLVQHPSAGDAQWERLAGTEALPDLRDEPFVLSALLSTAARRLKAVRHRALHCSDASVLMSLAEDAPADELRAVLGALCDVSPLAALDLIENGKANAVRELTETDLAPFLAHPARQVRERAATLLSTFRRNG